MHFVELFLQLRAINYVHYTIHNKYPYCLVLGVDNEIDGNPIRGDDMEMSSEEDGEIFDDVAQNPWASLQE